MEIGEKFLRIKPNQCLGKYIKILIEHTYSSFPWILNPFIPQVFLKHPGYNRHCSGYRDKVLIHTAFITEQND